MAETGSLLTASPPGTEKPAKGLFLYLAERVGGRTHGVDKFVRNEFVQPQGWPAARSAEGEAQG